MTTVIDKILRIASTPLCILNFLSSLFLPVILIRAVKDSTQPDISEEYNMPIFRFINVVGEKGYNTDPVIQIRVYLMILIGVLFLCAVAQIVLSLNHKRWLVFSCYAFVLASLIYTVTIVLEMNFVIVPDINENPLFYAESGAELWIISVITMILVIIDSVLVCINRTDFDDTARTLTINSRIRYEPMYYPSLSDSQELHSQPEPQPVKIVFTAGEHSGMKIDLNEGEKIKIGRDPSRANIVISSQSISRLHCTISFDYVENQYLLYDTSSNGICLSDGTKLLKGYGHLIPRGTALILDKEKNSILLT